MGNLLVRNFSVNKWQRGFGACMWRCVECGGRTNECDVNVTCDVFVLKVGIEIDFCV